MIIFIYTQGEVIKCTNPTFKDIESDALKELLSKYYPEEIKKDLRAFQPLGELAITSQQKGRFEDAPLDEYTAYQFDETKFACLILVDGMCNEIAMFYDKKTGQFIGSTSEYMGDDYIIRGTDDFCEIDPDDYEYCYKPIGWNSNETLNELSQEFMSSVGWRS